MRHANISDRKQRNGSECINNHLQLAAVMARTLGIESISSTLWFSVAPASVFLRSCFPQHTDAQLAFPFPFLADNYSVNCIQKQ